MVMTFVLHPLSFYNFITEPCARFLPSFLEDLFIDFPSHFILYLIDVYRDTVTYEKLIFPTIMAQLQHMDARLDTLSDELCQLTTRVGRIARRQACLGGFIAFPSPSPEASEDEDANDGSGDDDDDVDEDATSSSDEEMTTSQ